MTVTSSLGKYASKIRGKTILVTGGTGSFGSAVTEALLGLSAERIIIFSRDEKKQFDLGNRFNSSHVGFFIGDVRDRETVDRAMEGVHYVFHAAALKQVPTGEFFPLELVKTNVLGSHNVIHSAIDHQVKRVVILSTDKACAPINVMGMTKALMERVMIAAAQRGGEKTIVCGTRYGNVLYTRGSIVPFLIERIKAGKSITVTDPNMTRFVMTLAQSIDLVLFALTSGSPGEIYVRKAPAATVGDLAAAVADVFSYGAPVEHVGIRPGEKCDEFLISREERMRAVDHEDYFSIIPEILGTDYRDYYFKGKQASLPEEGYGSANTGRLSREDVKELLLSLPEVQKELAIVK
jgi:UDP-N-acetylglucosamine 4,6-dehydratase